MGVLTSLFSWRGRLGRRGFASTAFGLCLAFFPVDLVGTFGSLGLHREKIGETLPEGLQPYVPSYDLAGWLVIVATGLAILLGLSMLAISVRRFHDMSLSAWGVLLAAVVIFFLPSIQIPMVFGSIWPWVWLVALSFLPGSPEANEFGAGSGRVEEERAA